MLKALSKLAMVIAMLQICGGHWCVLQSAAWVRMTVAAIAAKDSIPTALEKAFDGKHPCNICTAVTKGRASEEKQEVTKIAVKVDAVVTIRCSVPEPRSEEMVYWFPASIGAARFDAVQTPPPRRSA